MYLDYTVAVPDVPGKIVLRRKGDCLYVEYEVERTYDPKRQYTNVKRVTIGKTTGGDSRMMVPNNNFSTYFPEVEVPEEKSAPSRSSCVKVGANVMVNRVVKELGLREILEGQFQRKDAGLVLDLAAYSVITEGNAGQHYPAYTYSHPLLTVGMHAYSDSKVSDFLNSVTRDQTLGFLNEWNGKRNHREKVYVSYDATNKNCQSGDVDISEFGHAKDDSSLPVVNYSIAYDTRNREPLFYEEYPGSINDVAQFRYMVDKTVSYGYRHIGFILDRGYFSKGNLDYMDENGYSYVIMAKGMKRLVSAVVDEVKGSFERKEACYNERFDLYGTTVKRKMFASDGKERFFHVYYSLERDASESRELRQRLKTMKRLLEGMERKAVEVGGQYSRYFDLHYDQEGTFLFGVEKHDVVEDELSRTGYFCIITSERMDASDALKLYKGRDSSEKLFRADKSFLGDGCYRVHTDEAVSAKTFIEFIALIIRCRIYNCLFDEAVKMDRRPNYMTVPAAIRELEKMEMVRQRNGAYMLDHAVTATQKTILKAFGIDMIELKGILEDFSRKLA